MASKKDLSKAPIFDKFYGPAVSENGTEKQETDSVSESRRPEQKEKTAKKPIKKVFSFRGDQDLVTVWRTYADAAGITVDALGTAAMEEYVKNHQLTADQQLIFDLKLKQKS